MIIHRITKDILILILFAFSNNNQHGYNVPFATLNRIRWYKKLSDTNNQRGNVKKLSNKEKEEKAQNTP